MQRGLWDDDERNERNEQRENLERVYSRIARAIIAFPRRLSSLWLHLHRMQAIVER
jgi:hypothetical protein